MRGCVVYAAQDVKKIAIIKVVIARLPLIY